MALGVCGVAGVSFEGDDLTAILLRRDTFMKPFSPDEFSVSRSVSFSAGDSDGPPPPPRTLDHMEGFRPDQYFVWSGGVTAFRGHNRTDGHNQADNILLEIDSHMHCAKRWVPSALITPRHENDPRRVLRDPEVMKRGGPMVVLIGSWWGKAMLYNGPQGVLVEGYAFAYDQDPSGKRFSPIEQRQHFAGVAHEIVEVSAAHFPKQTALDFHFMGERTIGGGDEVARMRRMMGLPGDHTEAVRARAFCVPFTACRPGQVREPQPGSQLHTADAA